MLMICEQETSIHPPPTQPAAPKILLIGDSLTAGYCNPAKPNATLIRGTYDAYSLVFERALREQQREASVQVVAFPGITLAGYDSELGMKEKFWNVRFCQYAMLKMTSGFSHLGRTVAVEWKMGLRSRCILARDHLNQSRYPLPP